jgi:hypothetical protein
MTIERKLRNDPNFPKPMRLGDDGRIRLFNLDEVEAYERRAVAVGERGK